MMLIMNYDNNKCSIVHVTALLKINLYFESQNHYYNYAMLTQLARRAALLRNTRCFFSEGKEGQ